MNLAIRTFLSTMRLGLAQPYPYPYSCTGLQPHPHDSLPHLSYVPWSWICTNILEDDRQWYLWINGCVWNHQLGMLCKCHDVISHDDIIKWKHFPHYWPFVRGIHRSTVNSPHKGQWRGALISYSICAWINDWVNNREAGDLRRQRAHYDFIVMPTGNVAATSVCCKMRVIWRWPFIHWHNLVVPVVIHLLCGKITQCLYQSPKPRRLT